MQKHKSLKLINWGKEEFEKTDEYKFKFAAIKKSVREKYALCITAETNFFKKLWLRMMMVIEIRQLIERISSHKNLHLSFYK